MTKAELIERVYACKHLPRDLTKKTVAQIVDAVFTEMGDYFIRARVSRNQAARLTYPGFGTFLKRRRPPRMVKNPRTGAPIAIPRQETITFSPGQELRSLLNRNGQGSSNGHGNSGKGNEDRASDGKGSSNGVDARGAAATHTGRPASRAVSGMVVTPPPPNGVTKAAR